MSTPALWIIAGPNGAGKSSVVEKHNKEKLPVVNPDVIAASLKNTSEAQKHIIAGRKALNQQKELIREKRSFIVETTFSGRAGFQLIKKAKTAGYEVNLVYVALQTFQQSQGRVYFRAVDGGHNVPIVDIKRRFDRVTQNMDKAISLVDRAFILDNTRLKPLIVAKVKTGQVDRLYPTLSPWLQDRLTLLKNE